jgi:hypothetical protein
MPLLRAAIVCHLVSGYQAVMNGAAPGREVIVLTGLLVSTSLRTLFVRWKEDGFSPVTTIMKKIMMACLYYVMESGSSFRAPVKSRKGFLRGR